MNQTTQANRREDQFALRRVGEVCELLNGLAFKPEEWSAAGVPIIRIQNLNGGEEFNFYEGFIFEDYVIKPSTLLFAWSGNRGTSFGPFVWRGPTGVLNQHIFKVTPKVGIDANWLHHSLQIAREHAEREAHGGSGLVHVRREDLLSFRIPTPGANEQSRIAAVLDTADEAIAKTEAVIAKLRQVRAGLLHDLLTRGLGEHGHLRDPIAHPEQFQNSPLGRIPLEWEVQSLESVTDPSNPICYGILQAMEFVPDGVRVLTIRDLLGDYSTGLHRTARNIDANYARSRVRPDDVLISVKGTIGRVAVVPQHFQGNISRDLVRIRPNNRVRARFLVHLLRSPRGQRILEQAQVGTTRAELSIAPLKRVSFAFPLPAEQERIAMVLDEHDALIRRHDQEFEKLVQLKSGLMADLLTGRVRVRESVSAVENQS